MTLARRILLEKRRIILPIVVVLAANALVYGVAVYPLRAKVAASQERARLATQTLQRGEAGQVQAGLMVQGKEQADEELKRFYSDVLPADLTGARRITYLRLAQLAERARLKYERRTIRVDRQPDSRLSKLRMTMVLAGEYENVRQFIYQLETSPEFVVIEDVTLAQAEEGSAPLVLTVELSTYYWAGSNGS